MSIQSERPLRIFRSGLCDAVVSPCMISAFLRLEFTPSVCSWVVLVVQLATIWIEDFIDRKRFENAR